MSHPPGITVEIVGIDAGDRGRNCEVHYHCGTVLEIDYVVRLKKVQVTVNDREETAIAAYWVTDGADRCRVGFLPRHTVRHWKQYDGKLAQIIEVYKDSDSPTKRSKWNKNKGCCVAAIIDTVRNEEPTASSSSSNKRKKGDEASDGLSDGD